MSFREAFTKEQKKLLLEYDDNASLYFGCTILLCILIPWATRLLFSVFCPHRSLSAIPTISRKGSHLKYCNCSCCTNIVEEKKKTVYSIKNRLVSWNFLLQFIGISILAGFFITACFAATKVSEIQTFNPFEILGVSHSSNDRHIKKAFRTLSLKHHPDKNPNDPSAAAKFIMITKAYQSLTDETARKNYEKYGNPDGPGAMEVGIGLPSMLVDESNQGFFLALLLLFLLAFVPFGFIFHYQHQKDFYTNGVRVETVHFIAYYMSENTNVKMVPEFLAASAESRELPLLMEADEKIIQELIPRVQPPKKRKISSPVIYRNYIILLAHMHRFDAELAPVMQENLKSLLRLLVPITQSMIEIAFVHNWFDVIKSIITTRRCLIQAFFPINSSPFLQIPHHELIKKKCLNTDFDSFLRLTSKERTQLLGLPEDKMEDINQFCQAVSPLELRLSAQVVGESLIAEGDVVTVYAEVIRVNMEEGYAAGPIHTYHYPELKFEELWLFLVNQNSGELITYTRCNSTERIVIEELRFLAPRPGTYSFEVLVMSDSYVGIDVKKELTFKVVSRQVASREAFVHPEDIQLDKELSFLAQLMGQAEHVDDSDEEDEE